MRSAACLLALTLCACAAPSRPRERLVVASDLDNAPFAFVDARGEPGGHDVELMGELARRTGLELTWRRMPFDALLPAAEAAEVDLVCATLGITAERAERVDFTRPYFHTRIVAVARAGPDEPAGLEALAGRLVAAGRGTTSERAVRDQLPAARLELEEDKGHTTEERLLSGAVDAAVMDEPAARALAARSAGRLVVLEPALAREDYALALPPGRGELVALLDRTLAELEAEGWLAALDGRHGLTER